MPKFLDLSHCCFSQRARILDIRLCQIRPATTAAYWLSGTSRFRRSTWDLPRPHNDEDAAIVSVRQRNLLVQLKMDVEIDEQLLKELSYQARGDFESIGSFLWRPCGSGSLKAVSGKFHPVQQWSVPRLLESLPTSSKRSEELCKNRLNSRIRRSDCCLWPRVSGRNSQTLTSFLLAPELLGVRC